MIKSKDEMSARNEIDLTGPEGNAFVLLGHTKKLAEELGLDGDAIRDEMKSGDYENLVNVFDENFGDYITLYR
jgi:hypothetical protein